MGELVQRDILLSWCFSWDVIYFAPPSPKNCQNKPKILPFRWSELITLKKITCLLSSRCSFVDLSLHQDQLVMCTIIIYIWCSCVLFRANSHMRWHWTIVEKGLLAVIQDSRGVSIHWDWQKPFSNTFVSNWTEIVHYRPNKKTSFSGLTHTVYLHQNLTSMVHHWPFSALGKCERGNCISILEYGYNDISKTIILLKR